MNPAPALLALSAGLLAPTPQPETLTVDGAPREAIVYPPARPPAASSEGGETAPRRATGK